MRRRTVVVVCLLVAAGCLPAAGGSAPATPTQQEGFLLQDQPEADNTVTRIALEADGSATWTIRFRTRLATDDDEAEYRRFQESFRNDTGRYLDPFRDRMTGVVANANDDVDREMVATEFRAETDVQEVPRRWGVVSYEFRWLGFAAVDGDRVVAGDVFDEGFYIGDDDALEFVAPPTHVVVDAEPTPDEADDGVVTWYGREDFADGEPRLVTEPATDSTPGDVTASSDDGAGEDGVATNVPSIAVVALGVLAVVGLVAVGVASRRGRSTALRTVLPWERVGEDEAVGGVASGSASAAGGDADGADGSERGAGAEAAGTPPGDLVTDEDRVLDLLRSRGGRVKQGDVVDAFDWSKSKTSRVLSRMADEDAIRKYRLGRENVIELPDDGE